MRVSPRLLPLPTWEGQFTMISSTDSRLGHAKEPE
jgi:hypothetical protein